MESNVKLVSKQHMKKSGNKRTNNHPKASKSTKAKPPVKVVYISNPMKIKTSASQFRALVQQLTGRDSEFPHHDPTKFSGDIDQAVKIGGDLDDDDDHEDDDVFEDLVVTNNNNNNNFTNNYYSSDYNSASNTSTSSNNSVANHGLEDDDVFMPQIMEGFGGILPSSTTTSVWYEY